jgi:hypothetical protein
VSITLGQKTGEVAAISDYGVALEAGSNRVRNNKDGFICQTRATPQWQDGLALLSKPRTKFF